MVKLYIAKGECPSLMGQDGINTFFGRDWMQRLVNVNLLSNEEVATKLQKLLDNYAETVFKPGLGKLEGITAQLILRPEATPRFHKSRPMPYALRPKVEETLKQMVNLEKYILVIGIHQLYP